MFILPQEKRGFLHSYKIFHIYLYRCTYYKCGVLGSGHSAGSSSGALETGSILTALGAQAVFLEALAWGAGAGPALLRPGLPPQELIVMGQCSPRYSLISFTSVIIEIGNAHRLLTPTSPLCLLLSGRPWALAISHPLKAGSDLTVCLLLVSLG